MKFNILRKKYNFFIYIIFIIILFLCIYNFLNYNESFKSRSKSIRFKYPYQSNYQSKSKYKCQNKIPCNNDETALYKCLTKTDIENNKDFNTFKGCKNSTKYKSQTQANNNKIEFKCKINDKCNDNNLISYTCVDEDNEDKIETSKANGWLEEKNFDKNYHKSCNSSYVSLIDFCPIL